MMVPDYAIITGSVRTVAMMVPDYAIFTGSVQDCGYDGS